MKLLAFLQSNERGDREVTFQLRPRLLDRLCRRPGKLVVLVQSDGDGREWRHKDSDERSNFYWKALCNYVREESVPPTPDAA